MTTENFILKLLSNKIIKKVRRVNRQVQNYTFLLKNSLVRHNCDSPQSRSGPEGCRNVQGSCNGERSLYSSDENISVTSSGTSKSSSSQSDSICLLSFFVGRPAPLSRLRKKVSTGARSFASSSSGVRFSA